MVAALTDPVSGEEKIVAAGGMSLIPMFDPMASVESTCHPGWSTCQGSLPKPLAAGDQETAHCP